VKAEPINPELESTPSDKKELEALIGSINAKCTTSKMDWKVMAKFLWELGVLEKEIYDIREFPIDVLRTLDVQWDDMVTRVNGGQA
jgi:hypothetical protein